MSISVFMTLSPMIILSSATCPVFQLSMLAWDGAAPDTNMPRGWVGRLCNWPCKGEQFTKSTVSHHKGLRSRMIRRGDLDGRPWGTGDLALFLELSEMNGDTGDHKGPPSHSAPPSPLRNPGPSSSIDAYWRTLAIALVILKQQ